MPFSIVVGSQWGDEGKAKVIDYLTERSDIVVRYQGGANAGHTVIAGSVKFIFHLVPSGIIYPSKTCVIANGVVVDIEQLFTEIDELKAKDISVENRLFVSDCAHIVLPYHKAQDISSESTLGMQKIGTTGRGIGPAYSDKATRNGIRVGEIVYWDCFVKKFTENFKLKKHLIESVYMQPFTLDCDEILQRYRELRERLIPFIADTSRLINTAAQDNKNVLFEGAQGTFLDIDHGTYPFVTSSNTVAGCVCTGAGIGPSYIDHVIGIVKTYTTRVGNGPFPTELTGELGEEIRTQGGEFGATTGRPRRCGWFDSVMIRKAVEINGLTRLALTKLDVLNTLPEINICTEYSIDGKTTPDFPSSPLELEKAKPVYETVEGWKEDISGVETFSRFPSAAQNYIRRIQELCGNIPILLVSVGADREQTIEVNPV
jgi:adenylosuccinate synthase